MNLEEIEAQIKAYHQMIFTDDEADFKYNKTLKTYLQEYIIVSNHDDQAIKNALLVLAKTTGCTDDQRIADDILSFLFDNLFINQNQYDFFYTNCSTARWY